MARHNIIFGNDKELNGGYAGFSQGAPVDDRARSGGAPYGYGQSAPQAPQFGAPQAPRYGSPQQGASQEELESAFARPSATGHDTGRMTMRDALNAITATLGTIVVVAVAVGASPLLLSAILGDAGAGYGQSILVGALVVGLIGGLVTGLVNAFKKQPSPVLVLAYAVFEGLLLGGLSGMLEKALPGIALQAVGATLAVAVTILVLFRAGILRTSPRLNKIFFVAMIAYLAFCLVNIGFSIFLGQDLRTGVIGLVIGALAVVMASYSLVMDFEDVQRGVAGGVPRAYAWRCAFGVAATMVWMYVEILRILAILRGN